MDWDFLSVFDLFIKIHLAFSIQCHQSLKQFLIFFENFVFKINEKARSPTAHETYVQFESHFLLNPQL